MRLYYQILLKSPRGVVGWERCSHTFFGPHLFALGKRYLQMWDPNDNNKTWLRFHRCASDRQIPTVSQKSTVKQVDPVWKFL